MDTEACDQAAAMIGASTASGSTPAERRQHTGQHALPAAGQVRQYLQQEWSGSIDFAGRAARSGEAATTACSPMTATKRLQ